VRKVKKRRKVDAGTIAPPEGEGVSAKTVSERGRQPRSLTDYLGRCISEAAAP
jgi:hypothetical protein